MATAGASIASLMAAAEVIAAAAEPWPIAAVLRVAAVQIMPRQGLLLALVEAQQLPVLEERVPAQRARRLHALARLMPPHTPPRRMAAAVVVTAAAGTGSRPL